MLDTIRNAGIMSQGVFIAVMGLLLVFSVLILFFFSIRILGKIGQKKKADKDAAD